MDANSFFYTLSTLAQCLATVFSVFIAVITFRVGNIKEELRRRAGTLVRWCKRSVMDDGEILNAWLERDYCRIANLFEDQLGPTYDNRTYVAKGGWLLGPEGTTNIDVFDIEGHVSFIQEDARRLDSIKRHTKAFLILAGLIFAVELSLMPFSPWLNDHSYIGETVLMCLILTSLIYLGLLCWIICEHVTS